MTLTLEPSAEIMNHPSTEPAWENDLAGLLEDLTQVQDELLDVLSRKRQCMAAGDRQGMADLQPVEQELCQRLQQCHDRRSGLLDEAGAAGPAVDESGGSGVCAETAWSRGSA